MLGPAFFRIANGRVSLTPEEATEKNEKDGECRSCGLAVRLHRKGVNGHPAHFVHRSYADAKQANCPLIGHGD